MKHTNEKFSLGRRAPKTGPQEEESITQDDQNVPRNAPIAMTEEEQLQQALAQIRDMEDKELLQRQNSQ